MSADEEEPVVLRAADQRPPAHADEPSCVRCGRFGAYVCDATDEDVCSLECRDACIQRRRETEARDAQLRRKLGIRVTGACGARGLDPLLASFDDCEPPLPPSLRANMRRAALETPTPVQMQVVPSALARANLLVVAPTGTGKTAAYVVPTLAQLAHAHSADPSSRALGVVLAPIRELASQIEEVTKALALGVPHMKTALLVGGVPMPPQLHRLQAGVQVIVATPGRFLDVFASVDVAAADERGRGTTLASAVVCVVDEVDVMLDVGFRAQLSAIVGLLPPLAQLQMLFFSATLSARVESLVQQILGSSSSRGAETHPQPLAAAAGNCLRVEVGGRTRQPADERGAVPASSASATYTVNASIRQQVVWAEDKAKKKRLFDYLTSKSDESTMRIPAASIHADKPQPERLRALEAFVNQDVRVLVSTNVLGRGIDLLHVRNVVVFDFPSTVADYVHLIGRTARGAEGETGSALVLVNDDDKRVFRELVEVLRAAKAVVPREIYARLAVDAKRQAFKTSAFAIDEAKRAFRISSSASESAGHDTQRSWHNWADHVSKKRRRS
ncbi:hypothetical protein PybrP1_009436 [[Pythium] brassicae (nom. inval.)]|nr:hypothetical protein PybrP1_009436 [[Pythium] brassicae (nom. inval.)]